METHYSSSLPQFGEYHTIASLGNGGCAYTYLVESHLRQHLVVKQIKPELRKQDPQFEEHFRQEAQMLASLKHPHIVEIRDFDPQEGYLVMPFAQGGTLRKLLDDDYPHGMEPSEALAILQQIARGLSYAHEQLHPTNGWQKGILHLDLKPENILIDIKSGSWRKQEKHYWIADFGIARWMSKTTGSPNGWSWFGAGTPGYRAPEQYEDGLGVPTVQSDVYALGVMTHEMLSGQRPPRESGKVLSSLQALSPAISSQIDTVVQKATKENPSERYHSVTGFLTALKGAVEKGREIAPTVPAGTTVFPPTPLSPKRPRLTRFLVIGVCALIAILVGASFLIPLVQSQSPRPITLCVAVNLPLSGTQATAGRQIRNGAQLAIDQNPLPAGYQMILFQMDDASRVQEGRPDPTVGVENIQNLPEQKTACPNPVGIIGPLNSSMAVEEIPVAAQQQILLVSPSNTAPCLTKKNFGHPDCIYDLIHPQTISNTYVRLPGTDIDQGYQIADFMWRSPDDIHPHRSGLGARKIYVVGDEEVYGTQLAQFVMRRLQDTYGLMPVGVDCVKPPQDFHEKPSCSLNPSIEAFSTEHIAALAAKIKEAHPEAIFFGGFTDRGAGLLRHALGEIGLGQIPFVGADALFSDTETFFKAVGPSTENIYVTFPAADPATFPSGSASETTFFSQYRTKFGVDPAGYSANGYDTANIIIESIKNLIKARKSVTSANVTQAVFNNNDGKGFMGVAGNRIYFDQNGDNTGERLYTLEQSQQNPNGVVSWKPLGEVPVT